MRKLITLVLLSTFAFPVHAGPKKRILLKLAGAGAGAAVHAAGVHHARKFAGREFADGKYGPGYGIVLTATILNFLMVSVSEKLPVNEGYAFAFAGPAAQLGHGIYEWRIRPEQVRH